MLPFKLFLVFFIATGVSGDIQKLLEQGLKTPEELRKGLEDLLKKRPFLAKGEHPTSAVISSPSNGAISQMNVLNKSNCNCVSVAKSRIIGGRTSQVSYPWMVSLDLSGGLCGGFIINSRQVVTAAHCTEGREPDQIYVIAGINDLTNRNLENAYEVEFIDDMPLYSEPGREISQPGDFSVLTIKADKPFDFDNPNLKPACVDSVIRDNYGTLLATGWGLKDTPINYLDGQPANKPQLPDSLKEADFKYMGFNQASETSEPEQCQKSHLVCLKPITEGDSVCSGDSGGPLHAMLGAKISVIGVAGFVSVRGIQYNGQDAQQACYGPGFYARVPYYRDFLESTTGAHNLCLIDGQNNLV
jgi:hypothetical protein